MQIEENSVVHSISKLLLASEIAFGCTNADVPEQELDLIEFPASIAAQSCTGASEIVRCDVFQSRSRCAVANYCPNRFGADSIAPDLVRLVNSSEYKTIIDSCRLSPGIDRSLYPPGNRDCANVPGLSREVRNQPAPISLLEIFHLKFDKFSAA